MSSPSPTGARAYCHRCATVTPSGLLPLTTGDIGHVCMHCRTCRKGRPYVTRAEFNRLNQLTPPRAEGCHEYTAAASR
jgi:hypothetical protein